MPSPTHSPPPTSPVAPSPTITMTCSPLSCSESSTIAVNNVPKSNKNTNRNSLRKLLQRADSVQIMQSKKKSISLEKQRKGLAALMVTNPMGDDCGSLLKQAKADSQVQLSPFMSPRAQEESLSQTLSPRKTSTGKKKLSISVLQRQDSINLLVNSPSRSPRKSGSKLPQALPLIHMDDTIDNTDEDDEDTSSTSSSSSFTENPLSANSFCSPSPNTIKNYIQGELQSASIKSNEDDFCTTRTVRFDESQNVSFEAPSCPKYNAELRDKGHWYRSQDYSHFRSFTAARVRRISKSSDRADKCYKKVIAGVYLSCCRTSVEQESVKLSPQAEKGLNICLDQWGKRLGLELMCVSAVQDDNYARRRESIRVVTNLQQEMRDASVEARADAIGQELFKVSRPSALFAHAVGQALAQAVVSDNLRAVQSKMAPAALPETTCRSPPTRPVREHFVCNTPPTRPSRRYSLSEDPTFTESETESEATMSLVAIEEEQEGHSDESSTSHSVQFNSDKIIIGNAANSQSLHDCWYSRGENETFRTEASEEVEQLTLSTSQAHSKYKSTLSALYVTCCRANQPKEELLSSEVNTESISQFAPQVQRNLSDCLSQFPTLKGLEMMALRCCGEEHFCRIRYHQKRVLDIQEAFQHLKDEKRETMIQQGVTPVSLPSRLFARELALCLQLSLKSK